MLFRFMNQIQNCLCDYKSPARKCKSEDLKHEFTHYSELQILTNSRTDMLLNLHRHCNTGLPVAHTGSTHVLLESGSENKIDKS